MNQYRVKLDNGNIEQYIDKNFNTKIDDCIISVINQNNYLEFSIEGEKTIDELSRLFFFFFSLFYIYLGAFPQIMEIEQNNSKYDISRLNRRFNTYEIFKKNVYVICNINDKNISQNTINQIRGIKKFPVYSMQALVSDAYKHILANHKILLLCHVIDGLVDKKDYNRNKYVNELNTMCQTSRKPGEYKLKVYHLCKNYFFKYYDFYNSDILNTMGLNKIDFINVISDTRNWYSHFLNDIEKPNKLTDGKKIIIYFDIILYSLRILLLDKLGISVNLDKIKAYLRDTNNWIKRIYNN